MKKYTIEDLREGKVLVMTNKDPEEIESLISFAFPEDEDNIYGNFAYYGAMSLDGSSDSLLWDGWEVDRFNKPVQDISVFMEELDSCLRI